MKVCKAKLTLFDNGKLLIEPYAHTDSPRYTPLLQLDYGTLSTTQEHYRLLLKFPRKEGIMAAVKHLLHDCTKVSNFLTNMFVNDSKI